MLNTTKLQIINKKLSDALEKISEEENVDINLIKNKNGDTVQQSYHLIITTKDESEKSLIRQANKCKAVGFVNNVISRTFTYQNDDYTIVNVKPRNNRYPVIAMNTRNNKMMKFTKEHIQSALGGDKLINRYANLKILNK